MNVKQSKTVLRLEYDKKKEELEKQIESISREIELLSI